MAETVIDGTYNKSVINLSEAPSVRRADPVHRWVQNGWRIRCKFMGGEVEEPMLLTLYACHSAPGRIVCEFSLARDCIEMIYTGIQMCISSDSQAAVRVTDASKLVWEC
jgi:hypothetical protein